MESMLTGGAVAALLSKVPARRDFVPTPGLGGSVTEMNGFLGDAFDIRRGRVEQPVRELAQRT